MAMTLSLMLTLALALPLSAARAQELPAAVGEITYAGAGPGSATCTGTLVAPDLVLTAGHCLGGARKKPSRDARPVVFSAGRNGEVAVAVAEGSERSFPQPVPDGGSPLSGDLGLLRLSTAIPSDQVVPLPLLTGPPGRFLTLVAYRRDTPGQPEVNEDCAVLRQAGDLLALTCPVVSGNSGAPLLQMTEDGPAIAAVMAAKDNSGGLIASWAVVPGPDVVAAISR